MKVNKHILVSIMISIFLFGCLEDINESDNSTNNNNNNNNTNNAQISAGEFHTCGLTTTGETYCWGWNYYGELGNGTTTDRTVPTPISFP